MRWVLDYTAQQSSGIVAWRRDTDHIEKAFVFAGMPARNGVASALLVRSGWNGVDDIFSGADNFFIAYAPKAQPERLVEKLGERYEIAQTDIKKWTVGSPIQGPLDALEAIRGKQPFEADQVQSVTGAPCSLGRHGRGQPRHARHLPAAHDRRDAARQDRLLSRRARQAAHAGCGACCASAPKCNLVRDEELAKLLPVRVTVVEIELKDGTRLSERVTAVRGTPRNPMSRAEVIDKARDLIAPVLGREISGRLIETIFSDRGYAGHPQLAADAAARLNSPGRVGKGAPLQYLRASQSEACLARGIAGRLRRARRTAGPLQDYGLSFGRGMPRPYGCANSAGRRTSAKISP